MRINDILTEPMVMPAVAAADKEGVLRQLAERLATHAAVKVDADQLHAALLNRERLGSTGVGEGVAIPHAKVAGLGELVACFARVPDGVAFEAIDGKPVKLLFVLLVPENSAGAHLKALARVSRLLKSEAFREQLLQQLDASSIYAAFLSEDAKS